MITGIDKDRARELASASAQASDDGCIAQLRTSDTRLPLEAVVWLIGQAEGVTHEFTDTLARLHLSGGGATISFDLRGEAP